MDDTNEFIKNNEKEEILCLNSTFTLFNFMISNCDAKKGNYKKKKISNWGIKIKKLLLVEPEIDRD